jgi:AraC-like DNA-binding protein
VRLAAGSSFRPDEIRFASRRTRRLRDVDILPGAPVAFEQDASAVGFPTSLLTRPLERQGGQRAMDGIDDVDRWTATAPADEFAASIAQVIATLASRGFPHVDVVAAVVGTSVRALQRRLSDAGTTYARVLARARLDAATRQLLGSDATVLDVALDTGYSDHAHFSRAFRRWSGVSPCAYRRANRDSFDAPRSTLRPTRRVR